MIQTGGSSLSKDKHINESLNTATRSNDHSKDRKNHTKGEQKLGTEQVIRSNVIKPSSNLISKRKTVELHTSSVRGLLAKQIS